MIEETLDRIYKLEKDIKVGNCATNPPTHKQARPLTFLPNVASPIAAPNATCVTESISILLILVPRVRASGKLFA